MSLLASWQGWVTDDGGIVAAWVGVDGDFSIRIGGVEFPGTTAASENGHMVSATFSGLASDASYTADLYLDGAWIGSRTVWTAKTQGQVTVLWQSCSNPRRLDNVMMEAIKTYQPDLIFFLGDTVYAETAPNLFGVTRLNPELDLASATETTEAGWNSNRFFLLKPSFFAMASQCPVILQWDDHEILGDFRNALAEMQSKYAWITSQADLDAAKAVRVAIADAVVHAGVPRDHYYYALDYSGMRFIVNDMITEKGSASGGDMISDAQMTWTLGQLDGAPSYTWMMGTKSLTDGNSDGWWDYDGFTGGDLSTILQHIHDQQITTVAWLTGDLHHAHAQYNVNPLGVVTPNAATPVLSVCACPASQFFTADGANTSDVVFRDMVHCVGVLRVASDRARAELMLVKLHEGKPSAFWRGYVEQGSNALSYDRARMG